MIQIYRSKRLEKGYPEPVLLVKQSTANLDPSPLIRT